jgi:hypothetical protein
MIISDINQFININSDNIKKLDRNSYIRKWEPIVNSQLKGITFNVNDSSNICLYLEVLSVFNEYLSNNKGFYTNTDQIYKDTLDDFKNKIINPNKQNNRSKIINKYFNYDTNKIEYELEDGNIITSNEDIQYPKIKISDNIFPLEFYKIIDMPKYRDLKINEIL